MALPRSANLYPPRWRVLLAFTIVPGAAAFLLASIEPAYAGLEESFERVWRTAVIFAIFGAYPTAFFLGVPAYFVLRARIAGTWFNCATAGAAVAGLPWLLLVLIGPSADQASIGGRATIIDGRKTVYGWLMDLQFIGTIAFFGMAAGLLFWLIAAAGPKARP